MSLPKMTEAQAYLYYDFCSFRLFGWNIVERKKHHHRSKATRARDEWWMRAISDGPEPWEFVIFAEEGRSVVDLWPEDMRVEVERQINTKVPRGSSEPTDPEFIKGMHECGRTDWVLPDFFANHGREA